MSRAERTRPDGGGSDEITSEALDSTIVPAAVDTVMGEIAEPLTEPAGNA